MAAMMSNHIEKDDSRDHHSLVQPRPEQQKQHHDLAHPQYKHYQNNININNGTISTNTCRPLKRGVSNNSSSFQTYYYCSGQDFYDEEYDEEDEEKSIEDILDFSAALQYTPLLLSSRCTVLKQLFDLYRQMYEASLRQQQQEEQQRMEESQRRRTKQEQHYSFNVKDIMTNEAEMVFLVEQQEDDGEVKPNGKAQVKGEDSPFRMQRADAAENIRGRSSNATISSSSSSTMTGCCTCKSIAILRGPSGTGKSTLVQQFHRQLMFMTSSAPTNKTILKNTLNHNHTTTTTPPIPPPYFLMGKYHEVSAHSDPLSAIVDAFQEFFLHVLLDDTTTSPQERGRLGNLIVHQVLLQNNNHHQRNPKQESQQDSKDGENVENNILTQVLPALKQLLLQHHENTATNNENAKAKANITNESTYIHEKAIARTSDAQEETIAFPEQDRKSSKMAKTTIVTTGNALNQLQYQFASLCKAMATQQRPLVLFLDDLQWCDTTSWQLLNGLLTDPTLKYFFFVGTYRTTTTSTITEQVTSLSTSSQHNHRRLPFSTSMHDHFLLPTDHHSAACLSSLDSAMSSSSSSCSKDATFTSPTGGEASETAPPSSPSSVLPSSSPFSFWQSMTPLLQCRTVIMDIDNLTLEELTQFVATVLHMNTTSPPDGEEEDGNHQLQQEQPQRLRALQDELVSVLHRKTKGNIFFTKQLLEMLHRQGLLEFSRLTFQWEWHITRENNDSATTATIALIDHVLSNNVRQAVTTKLQALSPELQHVLIVAAYINKSMFDVDTLYPILVQLMHQSKNKSHSFSASSIVNYADDENIKMIPTMTVDDLVKLLDEAVLNGLLANNTGSSVYSFEHDRIQQAAFGLVRSGKPRDEFRLRIGQGLFRLAVFGSHNDNTNHIFQPILTLGMSTSASSSLERALQRVPPDKEWMLFASADHWNASLYLYRTRRQQQRDQQQQQQRVQQRERQNLAMGDDPVSGYEIDVLTLLNLRVGYLAANKAAYDTASKYLSGALQALVQTATSSTNNSTTNKQNIDVWDTHYETALKIYSKMVDVELWQGHFETGKSMAELILSKARNAGDRLPTQLALAKAYGREEKHTESLNLATDALRALKVHPSSFVGGAVSKYSSLARNLWFVKRYFRKKRDDEIVSLPFLTDERYLLAMEFLNVASYQAYYVGNLPEFLYMSLRMLRITFEHGICGQSGVALIAYALVCNNLNDVEGAHRFSSLSRQVLDRTHAKHLEAIQMLVVAHWITGWRDPHPQVLKIFERGYRSGMETGDFENALLNRSSAFHHEYAAGYPLPLLDVKYDQLVERLRLYKIDAILVMAMEQWRKVQHLMGTKHNDVSNKPFLPLDIEELEKFGPERENDGSEKYRLLYGYLCRLELGFYFGSLEFARHMAEKTLKVDSDKSFTTNSLRLYFTGLTYASLARTTLEKQRRQRRMYRRQATKAFLELKSLCQIKGLNSWHRCMVLEAHLKAMMNGKEESRVEATYDRAVQSALSSGHIQDAGLGCQLAGEFFFSLNETAPAAAVAQDSMGSDSRQARDQLARKYLQQARTLYLQWGANHLVAHLETKYPMSLPLSAIHTTTTTTTTVMQLWRCCPVIMAT